jgi:hypothetical protein
VICSRSLLVIRAHGSAKSARRSVNTFREQYGLAYGKDCFPEQPYEPLKLPKPLLHSISIITYEKSFI